MERERTPFCKYRDDSDRVCDFHALRHTFISNLARGGVHPKLAQQLARHSTITLTMDRYTHTVRGELADALAVLPEGVAFLDRVRALALSALDSSPGPAYITTLREALGCTQQEFGERIGVDKMTVSRWERGTLKPSEESRKAIEELRHKAVRKGVVLPA